MLDQITRRKNIATAPVAPLTIRFATAADASALETLAELDSSHVPHGLVLVAEVGGELWAALSVESGHAIADPWRPSADAVLMLAQRSRQFKRVSRPRSHRLGRLRPAV